MIAPGSRHERIVRISHVAPHLGAFEVSCGIEFLVISEKSAHVVGVADLPKEVQLIPHGEVRRSVRSSGIEDAVGEGVWADEAVPVDVAALEGGNELGRARSRSSGRSMRAGRRIEYGCACRMSPQAERTRPVTLYDPRVNPVPPVMVIVMPTSDGPNGWATEEMIVESVRLIWRSVQV